MIFLSMLFLGLAGEPDAARLVAAIEMAENSPWTSHGGGLQFKPATWREATKLPFEYSQRPGMARPVARDLVQKYARKLSLLDIKPTPYLLGSIWNKGWTGAMELHRKGQKCKYGERVQNLFEAYTSKP